MDTVGMSRVWNSILRKLTLDTISEVRINGYDSIFYVEEGRPVSFPASFADQDAYEKSIGEDLVSLVRSATKDFRLDGYLFEGPLEYEMDGVKVRARCHIVLPPATDTPQITIAKRSTTVTTLEAISRGGSLSDEMQAFIRDAVRAKLGIVFSGATGAGKTTFLEAVAKLIPNDRRIGVAEDAPELLLPQPDATYLHSVPWSPGMDPNNVATLAWCVSQFKRMRVDSIIIGETRGAEFYDYLVATNSGLEGCMTTIHANNPRSAIEAMMRFAQKGSPQTPVSSLASDVAHGVDLVIQLAKTDSGSYRTTHIEEVTKTVDATGKIATNSLYEWEPSRDTHTRKSMMSDALRKRLQSRGVDISRYLGQGSGYRQEQRLGGRFL